MYEFADDESMLVETIPIEFPLEVISLDSNLTVLTDSGV